MRFAEPIWLFAGVVALAALFAAYLGHDRRQRAALAQFASNHLIEHLTASFSPMRRRFKRLLFAAAVGCIFVALARPQIGYHWEEEKQRGIDILFAVDTSRSMLTQDVAPDRLTRAKLAILDFTRKLDSDRVGLIAFARRRVPAGAPDARLRRVRRVARRARHQRHPARRHRHRLGHPRGRGGFRRGFQEQEDPRPDHRWRGHRVPGRRGGQGSGAEGAHHLHRRRRQPQRRAHPGARQQRRDRFHQGPGDRRVRQVAPRRGDAAPDRLGHRRRLRTARPARRGARQALQRGACLPAEAGHCLPPAEGSTTTGSSGRWPSAPRCSSPA